MLFKTFLTLDKLNLITYKMLSLNVQTLCLIGSIVLCAFAIWVISIRRGLYNRLEVVLDAHSKRIKKLEQMIHQSQQQQALQHQEFFQALAQIQYSQPVPVQKVQEHYVVNNVPQRVESQPMVQQVQQVQQPVKPVMKPVPPPRPKNKPTLSQPQPQPQSQSEPEETEDDLDALLKEELAELLSPSQKPQKPQNYQNQEEPEDISTEDLGGLLDLKKTTGD